MSIEKPFSHNKQEMKYDFLNGSIVAPQDMPFFNVKKGDSFQVVYEGGSWRAGSHTWSTEQLTEEVDEGIWDFVKHS